MNNGVVSVQISIHRYELKRSNKRTRSVATFTTSTKELSPALWRLFVSIRCKHFFSYVLRLSFLALTSFYFIFSGSDRSGKRFGTHTFVRMKERKERGKNERQKKETNRVRFSYVSFLGFPSRGVFWLSCDFQQQIHFKFK